MRVLVAALVALALAAGCVAPLEPACSDATLMTPWIDKGYLRTDPAQPWDTVVLASEGAEAWPSAAPAGWGAGLEPLSPPGNGSGPGGEFSLLRVEPGSGPGHLELDYVLDSCEGALSGTVSWDLMAPVEGESAQPGQGVHVYTAGFWENGTLFYTNIAALDHSDWPRAGWYAWEGAEPLPVYVYDEDRAEQPALWKDPQAGTPLAGTVHGLGYFTTIPGFNEALKGLSSSTVRVVRMEPEDGYTRAGNEEHPLYGAPLVFYIKVVEVVDLPCPLRAAASGLCGLTAQQREAPAGPAAGLEGPAADPADGAAPAAPPAAPWP